MLFAVRFALMGFYNSFCLKEGAGEGEKGKGEGGRGEEGGKFVQLI